MINIHFYLVQLSGINHPFTFKPQVIKKSLKTGLAWKSFSLDWILLWFPFCLNYRPLLLQRLEHLWWIHALGKTPLLLLLFSFETNCTATYLKYSACIDGLPNPVSFSISFSLAPSWPILSVRLFPEDRVDESDVNFDPLILLLHQPCPGEALCNTVTDELQSVKPMFDALQILD